MLGFLERFDLGVERGDVLGAPVVGELFEAEPLEHFGPLGGAAAFGVEGDDAPGDEVFLGEEGWRIVWGSGLRDEGAERCRRQE